MRQHMFDGSELWKGRLKYKLVQVKLSSGKKIVTYPDLPPTLYETAARHAAENPEKTAVTDSYGRSFSYRELVQTADALSRVFRWNYGIRKGNHVAMMLYSTCEFAAALLALMRIGAAAVMLPTKYRQGEIKALAERADLDYVLCDTDYLSYFTEYESGYGPGVRVLECHTNEETFAFDALLKESENLPEPDETGGYEDISVMMFTSGTTSLSKGVMLPNYALMHAAASYALVFGIKETDSTVIPVPTYMITGLSGLLGTFLYAGGTIHLQKFFHAQDVLSCVREKKVTFMHAAPTVYALLAEHREEFPSLPSLRLLACGGGRTPKQLIRKIHEWLNHCEFRTVYGLTESSSPGTILPEDASMSPDSESCGFPIPGMKIRIVDEAGHELPNGQIGEILMHGANLLDCYYKIDSPLYQDGWFHTGDVGYFSQRGCCYVVDRIKDMINRGGEKVISSDVEKELLELDGVEEAAVIGIPDEMYGEVPVAVVRLAKDSALDEEKIRGLLKTRIAGYKVPVQIRFVDRIPLTANSKYDKKGMKKLFES